MIFKGFPKRRKMIVQVNNKEVDLPEDADLQVLTERMELPSAGVAVAVNNRMVARERWQGFALQARDQVVIIKAACGG